MIAKRTVVLGPSPGPADGDNLEQAELPTTLMVCSPGTTGTTRRDHVPDDVARSSGQLTQGGMQPTRHARLKERVMGEGEGRREGLLGAGVLVTGVSASFHGVLPLPGPFTFQRAGALVLKQQGRLAPGKNTELSPPCPPSSHHCPVCVLAPGGAIPGTPKQRLSLADGNAVCQPSPA